MPPRRSPRRSWRSTTRSRSFRVSNRGRRRWSNAASSPVSTWRRPRRPCRFPKRPSSGTGARPRPGLPGPYGKAAAEAIPGGARMESARWARIQELFHAAADLPGADKRSLLKSACAGDEALFADVLSLIDEYARATPELDLGRMVHEVLGGPALAADWLGEYRIVTALGGGGMVVVYLAERKDVGRLVALKVLRDAWVSPARRERFAAEQQTLARLDHPSIARLYDSGALGDGTPFFVMEYVDGKPLTTYSQDNGADLEERLRLFHLLCEAVQSAHAHAIIHRDIKPSNVLVKRDGTVRLLDFGIAKQLDTADVQRTMTGLRFMTPAYAAPEQFRG